MTVAELEDRMSAAELERWARFEQEEPFLATRIEYVGGLICSVLANINRAKHAAALEPLDFMPFLSRQIKQAEVEMKMRQEMPQARDAEEEYLQRAVIVLGGRYVN